MESIEVDRRVRTVAPHRDAPIVRTELRASRQADEILHWGFVAAPTIAGIDKFTRLLTNWDKYPAPQIARVSPVGGHGLTLIIVVGVEIAAGLLVALRPRIGAYVVAAWLAGVIANLLLLGGYYDVARRDFGLALGALALGRLASRYDHGLFGRPRVT